MEVIKIALPIILIVLLALAGGYIKKLVKETKGLIDVVSEAIEDDTIDDREIAMILEAGKDVGKAIIEIVKLITKRD